MVKIDYKRFYLQYFKNHMAGDLRDGIMYERGNTVMISGIFTQVSGEDCGGSDLLTVLVEVKKTESKQDKDRKSKVWVCSY